MKQPLLIKHAISYDVAIGALKKSPDYAAIMEHLGEKADWIAEGANYAPNPLTGHASLPYDQRHPLVQERILKKMVADRGITPERMPKINLYPWGKWPQKPPPPPRTSQTIKGRDQRSIKPSRFRRDRRVGYDQLPKSLQQMVENTWKPRSRTGPTDRIGAHAEQAIEALKKRKGGKEAIRQMQHEADSMFRGARQHGYASGYTGSGILGKNTIMQRRIVEKMLLDKGIPAKHMPDMTYTAQHAEKWYGKPGIGQRAGAVLGKSKYRTPLILGGSLLGAAGLGLGGYALYRNQKNKTQENKEQ